MEPHTYLTIDDLVFAQGPMRRINQELTQIDSGGDNVRLANGRAFALARTAFRKYRTSISGTSEVAPPISHLWRGMVVRVGCIQHLELPGDVADADLPRTPVPGSVKRFRVEGLEYVEAARGTAGIVLTRFRPQLTIVLSEAPTISKPDEWDGRVNWSIEGEEV